MGLLRIIREQNASAYLKAIKNPSNAVKYVRERNGKLNARDAALAGFCKVGIERVNELLHELEQAHVVRDLHDKMSSYMGVEHGMFSPVRGPALYVLVRILKPDTVVETGVANGASSTYLLKAMAANRKGKLHSIDLPMDDPRFPVVIPKGQKNGWLIPIELRDRHELILGDSRIELPRLLERLGAIDWFFHDSLHTYEHMKWEFESAWPYIRDGGLLLADNIDLNRAFDDIAATNESIKFDVAGAVRKP